MRETLNLVHDLTQHGIFLRTLSDKLAVDTSDPGPGTDMAIALLAMFAQMERIYMLGRAAGGTREWMICALDRDSPATSRPARNRSGSAEVSVEGSPRESRRAAGGRARSAEMKRHCGRPFRHGRADQFDLGAQGRCWSFPGASSRRRLPAAYESHDSAGLLSEPGHRLVRRRGFQRGGQAQRVRPDRLACPASGEFSALPGSRGGR